MWTLAYNGKSDIMFGLHTDTGYTSDLELLERALPLETRGKIKAVFLCCDREALFPINGGGRTLHEMFPNLEEVHTVAGCQVADHYYRRTDDTPWKAVTVLLRDPEYVACPATRVERVVVTTSTCTRFGTSWDWERWIKPRSPLAKLVDRADRAEIASPHITNLPSRSDKIHVVTCEQDKRSAWLDRSGRGREARVPVLGDKVPHLPLDLLKRVAALIN